MITFIEVYSPVLFFYFLLDNKFFRGIFLVLVNLENIMIEIFSVNKDRLMFVGKLAVNGLLVFLIYFTFIFNLSQVKPDSYRWKKIIKGTTDNNFLRYGIYLDRPGECFLQSQHFKMDGI